ncbi:MAG TPA: amidohydrolase family protein [Isosphaeraceae bacterium]|nr:amidohydrolase family protein [Isosphaeraceae bacterium]
MRGWLRGLRWWGGILGLFATTIASAEGTRGTTTYHRIKAALDATPAIDTHDHLWPFDRLPALVETPRGKGVNLAGLWRNSYFPGVHRLTPWTPGMTFDAWWAQAKDDFDDARATSVYRYQLPAFTDLYGVDFDRITAAQARALDQKIFANYRDPTWLFQVVTERANIELMFNDPYWGRFDFKTDYPFGVFVFNVTTLVSGFDPSEFKQPSDDPYRFARKAGLPIASLDDYLVVLDRLFQTAKAAGAACLKTTLAYQRTLRFEDVPRERAARAFGRPRSALTTAEIKDFEDFIMWRLVELSARYGLPFQIHTGHGRIQGSNPMNLVDLIEANPRTKFILFHGGFPWVGETGIILMRHSAHVWLDSCWMPTLSYSTAKRAYHEWLEVMPSSRIMWGADANHAEGIYGATEMTRRCLAEVLAEKVDRGDLLEDHALRIGRQVLRDNALALFPQLQDRLWKHKEIRMKPPEPAGTPRAPAR